jgi:hypothetical protein
LKGTPHKSSPVSKQMTEELSLFKERGGTGKKLGSAVEEICK